MTDLDQYMLMRLDELIEKVTNDYETYAFDDVSRRIMNYVTHELSAFCLDYAKDIIYIEHKTDSKRLSTQTVIYEHLIALLKLLTPLLPHTTEEAYAFLPYKEEDSVYLENMPTSRYPKSKELIKRYDTLLELRENILKALEEARNEKVIGKSLQAHVVLYPNQETKTFLESFTNLNKLFIVSQVSFSEGSGKYSFKHLSIDIKKAEGETCARCWHVTTINEEELCERCVNVLKT